MWSSLVELVLATIFGAANICGGNVGWAVALVSFALRVALIPLTIRVQRRARETQEKLARIRPKLAWLEKRWAAKPDVLALETLALYKREGVRAFDPVQWVSFGVQAPLFLAVNSVVRSGLGAGVQWLWVAELARPDKLLAVVASVMVGVTMWPASKGGPVFEASGAPPQYSSIVFVVVTVALKLLHTLCVETCFAASSAGVASGRSQRP